nr:MAG: hypothetical protein [Hemigrapsus takanoi nimavirus]
MGKDDCGVCGKKVEDGVCCERCEVWSHQTCVGLSRTPPKVLENTLLIFLCTMCLDTSREEWKNSKGNKKERMEGRMENKAAQTECLQQEAKEVEPEVVEIGVRDAVGGKDGCKCVGQGKGKAQMMKKAVKRVPPIQVVGDSMMKNVKSQLGCKAEGSGVESLSGARIGEVKRKVEEKAGEIKDGLLIIQGGGNNLENIGTEDTVKEVVEAVKAMEGKKVSVAVVGVMRRPREGERYERIRQRTNARLQEELVQIKIEWMKERKGNVSFIDLDGVLREGMDFNGDGVHLNQTGLDRMGRRLREWRNARSIQCVDV